MYDDRGGTLGLAILRVHALLLAAIGTMLAGGGAYLLILGGSWYYLLCGIAVVSSAIVLWMRRAGGALLYGLMLLLTLAWSLWEAGYSGWALMPRVAEPTILGLVLLIAPVRRALIRRSPPWSLALMTGAVVTAILLGVALRSFVPPEIPADPLYQTGMAPAPSAGDLPGSNATDRDWSNYGNDVASTRFSTLTQITPADVGQLDLVWTAPPWSRRQRPGDDTAKDRPRLVCLQQSERRRCARCGIWQAVVAL